MANRCPVTPRAYLFPCKSAVGEAPLNKSATNPQLDLFMGLDIAYAKQKGLQLLSDVPLMSMT